MLGLHVSQSGAAKQQTGVLLTVCLAVFYAMFRYPCRQSHTRRHADTHTHMRATWQIGVNSWFSVSPKDILTCRVGKQELNCQLPLWQMVALPPEPKLVHWFCVYSVFPPISPSDGRIGMTSFVLIRLPSLGVGCCLDVFLWANILAPETSGSRCLVWWFVLSVFLMQVRPVRTHFCK